MTATKIKEYQLLSLDRLDGRDQIFLAATTATLKAKMPYVFANDMAKDILRYLKKYNKKINEKEFMRLAKLHNREAHNEFL